MYRTQIFALLLVSAGLILLLSGFSLSQDQTEGSNIQALQKQLEGEFVAPCCWREAVATHQSGDAEEVKREISMLLAEGKDRDGVRAWMVEKYGNRILITPEATGFNLLVWIGPFIMLFLGLIFVIAYLYKIRPAAENSRQTA
ncbi:cytochrome c-type biogenesis protein CcmH [candidate division KSB1 bacterium]